LPTDFYLNAFFDIKLMLKKGFLFKNFFEKIRFFENEGNKKLIVIR